MYAVRMPSQRAQCGQKARIALWEMGVITDKHINCHNQLYLLYQLNTVDWPQCRETVKEECDGCK